MTFNALGNWTAILPPTSFHTGGVNICLGDGSVRFISDTINHGDLTIYPSYRKNKGWDAYAGLIQGDGTGPSAFGPWGALGSMNGGETTAL